ncbi:unnamed protein product [Cuscuta campestris]|uniref:Rad21/Rec8-like protein N-terminal domain-containing protein n=1 Tax=Cuscuta campestris TaxID=132261 RepID=A0A484LAR3_9ASTE|nr:unnamed protein product [Cuscuta campestris]
MFYSHVLLSKKGHLGNIWIAAHFYKRLKRFQVSQTNISYSVDKILVDEVPVVTYRILGHLLVGIVRIYSKKVEYLFHDCHKVLAEFVDFAILKRSKPKFGALHSSCCPISLPRSFELDAFELDDQDGCNAHVRQDAWKSEHFGLVFLPDKSHGPAEISISPANSPDHTPIRDVCSPYFAKNGSNVGSTSYKTNLIPMEKLCLSRFSLEKCIYPLSFEDTANIAFNDQETNQTHQTDDEQIKQPGSDIYNLTEFDENCTFSLEDRLDPMIIDDDEFEAAFAHEQIKHLESDMSYIDMVPLDKSSYEKQPQDLEPLGIREITPPNCAKLQTSINHPVSLSVDVIRDSKCPGGSGTASLNIMSVRTPAAKERSRALKKRRCVFDNPVVISNHVYKNWLNNQDDLIHKRKKAPHIPLLAWKHEKFSSLPGSLTEPLIPCCALVDTSHLVREMANMTVPVDSVKFAEINDVQVSPAKHRSREQTPIAPSTPVALTNSCRIHEAHVSDDLDIMEPPHSVKSMHEVAQETEDLEFDINLMDEETNSGEGDILEKYECSARTRKVAMFLLRHLLARKGKPVNLSCTLEGRTKTQSAKVFYEILVLKTEGWIDVRQDDARGDICVFESPKLKPNTFAEGKKQMKETHVL